MSQVVLFVLGQKGFEVLKAAVRCGFRDLISGVVIGRDTNIDHDAYDLSRDLCAASGIEAFTQGAEYRVTDPVENLVAVAAGWRWLIHEPFRQVIVFHDSLLPKYRGFNPLVTALIRRDSVTGVTAIIATKNFDRGDVIDYRKMEIEYPIKIGDAINSMSALYSDLALAIFAKLRNEMTLTGTPQDETAASYSVWRDEEDYRIDWSQSSEEISHFIRCVSYPYKGASTICGCEEIRILGAEVVGDMDIVNRGAGKVLFVDDGKPVVICGRGLLRITEAFNSLGRNILPLKRLRTRFK